MITSPRWLTVVTTLGAGNISETHPAMTVIFNSTLTRKNNLGDSSHQPSARSKPEIELDEDDIHEAQILHSSWTTTAQRHQISSLLSASSGSIIRHLLEFLLDFAKSLIMVNFPTALVSVLGWIPSPPSSIPFSLLIYKRTNKSQTLISRRLPEEIK